MERKREEGESCVVFLPVYVHMCACVCTYTALVAATDGSVACARALNFTMFMLLTED